jgi:hypothetical protein
MCRNLQKITGPKFRDAALSGLTKENAKIRFAGSEEKWVGKTNAES